MKSHAEHPPVVVVDADDTTRAFIVRCLERLNLRNPLVEVADADGARALLTTQPATPALVVLDLHLKSQSGLEVLRSLRTAPRTLGVPVVLLTRSEQEKELEEAYTLGVFAYLVKPVRFAALREVVSQMGLPFLLLAPAEGAAAEA